MEHGLKRASVRESVKPIAANQAIGVPMHGDVAGRDDIQLRNTGNNSAGVIDSSNLTQIMEGSGGIQVGRVVGNVTILNLTLYFSSGGAGRAAKQVKMAQCFRTDQQQDILAIIREIAAHMAKPATPNPTKRPRKTAAR